MVDEGGISLRDVLRPLRRWWPVVLACTVVGAATAGFVAPTGEGWFASSTVEYVEDPYLESLSGVSTISGPERIREVAGILNSDRFLRENAPGVEEIIATPTETSLFMTVRGETRAVARRGLAQAIAALRRLNEQRVAGELQGLRARALIDLETSRPGSRAQRQSQAQLRQIELAQAREPTGVAPDQPLLRSASDTSTLTAVGGVLGFILGLGLVMGTEMLRGRVRSRHDLARLDVPLLGELAADDPAEDQVALQRLGARLRRMRNAQAGSGAIIVLHDELPEAERAVVAVADALAAAGVTVAVATVDGSGRGEPLADDAPPDAAQMSAVPRADRMGAPVATEATVTGRRAVVTMGQQEHLGGVAADRSLAMLQEHHDVVLVEGPISRGRLPPIGPEVGAAIHLIRAGGTRRPEVASLQRTLSEMDLPLMGALLLTSP